MGGLSIWHILLIAVIVLVLFGGRGKLSDIMGDFAKGIKSFKKGLSDEEQPPQNIEHRDETKKDSTAH
ncbi:MAG: twin-arginine translocase TatA/TatE family subunit [Alphaproteobacteria bacterium]|nr:twin-arginine translocase TatA/TatE family subunit [Alphaproteobacteria bacterium]